MTRPDLREGLANRSALWNVVWFALLSLPAAAAAYYRIYSGFGGWDDEGTELAMVRQFLGGAKLYEEIFSPYGPVYFYYNWVLHAALGIPLDHNGVRLTSAVVALCCSLGCAWLVLRLTQSLAVAAIVCLAVFRGVQFFGNEPGHPQELCLMLALCLVASGIWSANPRWRAAGLAMAGSIAACLLLIKVNIGIFAILAVTLAIVFQAPAGWPMRLARALAGFAALALPFALMHSHIGDPAGRAYCFIVSISVAALLIGPLAAASDAWFSYRHCLAALGGLSLTLGAALLAMAARGIQLSQVLNMLVLKHVSLSVNDQAYYRALDLGWNWTLPLWMAWAIAGACAAGAVARSGPSEAMRRMLAPAQFVFGCVGLLAALALPKVLIGMVTPFCWLLLFPPRHPERHEARARTLLCTMAVLQTLIAYPMAGSQMYFIRIPLMVVAAVALVDGLRGLPQTNPFAKAARRYLKLATVAVLTSVGLTYLALAYRARQLYDSLTPFGMPGAERVHVEPIEAQEYHWMVDRLSRSCDTFVGLPQYPSLYFWTGKPLPGPAHRRPGGLNMDSWMLTHSVEEQQAIVDDLETHPNACAIYSPRGVISWYRKQPDLSGSPLATYILTRFKTVDQFGDYRFMIRLERKPDLGPYPRTN